MGLRDKLSQERAAVEQQKAQSEEEKFKAIRTKIADLNTKKEKLKASKADLEAGYEELGKRKAVVRAKRKPVEETVDQFKDVLATKKVKSTRDLVNNEEYKDEPEVAEYLEAKRAFREQAQDLKKKKRAVKGDKNPEKKNVSKKEADAILEEEINVLETESKELFDQTPEGEEAKRQEIKERLAKRHQERKQYSLAANNVDINVFITSKDIEDAKKFGAEITKDILRGIWSEQIDASVNEQIKIQKLDLVKTDLEKLEGVRDRMDEARRSVNFAERKKEELVAYLTKLFSDPTALNKYNEYVDGSYSAENPKSVEAAVQDYMRMIGQYLRRHDLDKANKNVNTKISVERIRATSSSFSYSDGYQVTDIPNPEYIIKVANIVKDFYQRIIEEGAQTFPGPVDMLREDVAEPEYIRVHKSTLELLNTSTLNAAQKEVSRKLEPYERLRSKLKQDLDLVLEKKWAAAELEAFRSEHSEVQRAIYKKDDQERLKKRRLELSKELANVKVYLSDVLDQTVYVKTSDDRNYSIRDLSLDQQIETENKEIKDLEKTLGVLDQEINDKKYEKPGLFGNKNKIARELQALEDRRKVVVKELGQKRMESVGKSRTLDHFNTLARLIRKSEFGTDYNGIEMTVRELLQSFGDKLYEEPEETLTPEEQELYKTFKSLEQRAKDTEEVYNKRK
jgi:hypothetical protein